MTGYEREKEKIIRLIAQRDKMAIINNEPLSCIKAECSICGMCYSGNDYFAAITEWLNFDDGVPSPERVKGQEEAWELVQRLMLREDQGGLPQEERKKIFGHDANIIMDNTYAEAAEKVKAWEESKKIKRGDVVRDRKNPDDFGDMVVIEEHNACEKNIRVVYGNFCTRMFAEGDLVKTGRTVSIQDWKEQWFGETSK